ncbi:cold shock CspA family protein [Pseudomonas cedrina]|nr:cold shock CspA family protein [Pseudomonas cedrina]
MAKPITTTTKEGVITSVNDPVTYEIVIGRPTTSRSVTVQPDDGTGAVDLSIDVYNSRNFQTNDRVKYVVTDGPQGPYASSLEKI